MPDYIPCNSKKESSNDIARCPLELLMKNMQHQRSQRWVPVWLMEGAACGARWEAYEAFHVNQ